VVESFAQDEPNSATASPEGAGELLNHLLEALKPHERFLIRSLDLEQKTVAEVCALTGWNNGLTRIRAFRARRKLRDLFRKLEESARGPI